VIFGFQEQAPSVNQTGRVLCTLITVDKRSRQRFTKLLMCGISLSLLCVLTTDYYPLKTIVILCLYSVIVVYNSILRNCDLYIWLSMNIELSYPESWLMNRMSY